MERVVFIRSSCIYNDSRATKEILALADAGYYVYVLGWDRNGEAEKRTKDALSERSSQIEISFYQEHVGADGLGIRNIDVLYRWIRWTKKQLLKLKDVRYVHACDLDGALGVVRYCKRKKIRFVYDIYDYYVDTHSIPTPLKRIVEGMEIYAINTSALALICTEERREQIQKAQPRRIAVIHNTPKVERIEEQALIYDYAYCGLLSGDRLIDKIVDIYPQNSDLKIVMAGHGPAKEQVNAAAQDFCNFEYLGSVTYAEVLQAEAQSRVISAIYDPSIRNHRLCAPNKFYEALALGKPVIVCRGTGIDRIVEEKNIGIVIDYDAEQFYHALRELVADDALQKAMGSRARKLYDEEYNWNIMERRLIKAYEEISVEA